MKKIPLLFLIVLFHNTSLFSQNIKLTSSNYYNYYKNTIETGEFLYTGRLNKSEVVPIIKKELEKYGFENNFDYKLYKLENGQFIILDIYNEKENIGFVYTSSHHAFPNKEHRERVVKYNISYNNYLGKSSGLIEVKLPKNIYALNKDWYWYQYKDNKGEVNEYVDRHDIIEILRSDVRRILSLYKNLNSAREKHKWKEVYPNPKYFPMVRVDSWPKYIDGKDGINSYISNFKKYPEKAINSRIEGNILVEFKITVTGKLEEVEVFKGGNKLLEKEAIRLIENMPNWKPAIKEGKPYEMKYFQEIKFRLCNN